MNKKKRLVIFSIILLAVVFVVSSDVYADNEWLKYGDVVSCGNIKNIPIRIPNIVSMLISILNVAVPVILVIFGTIDLAKGMMAGDENEIKKGRQAFIKRIIAGACVYLIILGVKLLVNIVDENTENKTSIISCINCFISGECNDVTTIPESDVDE